jgi:hypothetical protein
MARGLPKLVTLIWLSVGLVLQQVQFVIKLALGIFNALCFGTTGSFGFVMRHANFEAKFPYHSQKECKDARLYKNQMSSAYVFSNYVLNKLV